MTVTNSHAELPERDWTEHFPESPPDFRDGPDFRESIAPFIAEPETYDSLFTDGRAEARGGINFRPGLGQPLGQWEAGVIRDDNWASLKLGDVDATFEGGPWVRVTVERV